MLVIEDEWGCTETFIVDDDHQQESLRLRDIGMTMVKTGIRLYGDGGWSTKNGWSLASENRAHDEKAYCVTSEKLGKVIAVETAVNVPLSAAFDSAWNDVESIPTWNPTVKDYRILRQYSDHTRVVLNASHAVLGGFLSSRDFVDVNSWRKIGDAYYLAGRSVEYSGMPPQKGRIRGENLIGWLRLGQAPADAHCTSMCLMASTDCKGMLPRSIVERGMTHYVVEYVRNFKKHLELSVKNKE